jgi:hypothetical protein
MKHNKVCVSHSIRIKYDLLLRHLKTILPVCHNLPFFRPTLQRHLLEQRLTREGDRRGRKMLPPGTEKQTLFGL